MKILSLTTLSFLLLSACSRINVQSKDYYNEQHVRHGVYPLSPSMAQKFDADSVSRGKALYVSNCLSCHGATGLGDGPVARNQKVAPANLQKLAKEVPNFKFFMSISQWQGDMPGWKEQFNDQDREDLVAYVKTFK